MQTEASHEQQNREGRGGAGARVERILRRLVLVSVALFLFILAIQLMKTGAKVLAPDLKGTFPVDNAVSTLGLGWIGAYLVLSGSPVAAVALSLFAASALSEFQAFTMLSGSRLGASFIVLLVGFLYSLKSKNPRESTGMGVLALSLTAVVYLPGMLIGYGILKAGLLNGVHWTASQQVQGLIERIWGPFLALAQGHMAGWMLFPLGLGVLLVSFKLLDQVLPQIDSDLAARGKYQWLRRPWPMFALGCVVALLTLSVSVAITLLVPLAAKGYVDRREAMPYIMGANITTLADTLVAAMILGRPEGVQVVLAEAIAVAFVTIIYLAFLYRPIQDTIMSLDEWVVGTNRRLMGFVVGLFVFPGVLLLSGRITGVGGHIAKVASGQLWLSLVAAVLIALPIWALVDAVGRPGRYWHATNATKGIWVAALALTAPFGIGFLLGLVYLMKIRPPISAAELVTRVALWGDEVPI